MRQFEDPGLAGNYNVGPEEKDCVTTGELADLFCQAWGQGLQWINRSDGGPHEASFLKLDCSRIKKILGWQPRYGVNEAVRRTVEWSRAYLDGMDVRQVMDQQILDYFSAPASIS